MDVRAGGPRQNAWFCRVFLKHLNKRGLTNRGLSPKFSEKIRGGILSGISGLPFVERVKVHPLKYDLGWAAQNHSFYSALLLQGVNTFNPSTEGPADPETPRNSKTQKKKDSRVTFGAPAKVTQKLLKSDSEVPRWSKK